MKAEVWKNMYTWTCIQRGDEPQVAEARLRERIHEDALWLTRDAKQCALEDRASGFLGRLFTDWGY